MNKASFEDRKKIPPENFGDPEKLLFPILEQQDLDKAANRIRRHSGRAEVAKRIIDIGKRKGFTVPKDLSDLIIDDQFKASDDVPVVVRSQETVFNNEQVQELSSKLDAVLEKLQGKDTELSENKTAEIVNILDPKLLNNYMSTKEGEKLVLNLLKNSKNGFQNGLK